MNVPDLIQRIRHEWAGLNSPATSAELAELQREIGPLPEDVLLLYRDHNGSRYLPPNGGNLPIRPMPIAEVLELKRQAPGVFDAPGFSRFAWLWTDDNSNYVGVYTTGPLAGWLLTLIHDDAGFAPRWRDVVSFLEHLFRGCSADESSIDVTTIPQELPVTVDRPENVADDRRLARFFKERYKAERDPELRRVWAECSVSLTPVAETASVAEFLEEEDIWVPEFAVGLLEKRQFKGLVSGLERLAREGRHNGDRAAMRCLCRMKTSESRAAVARLRRDLQGQKRLTLEMWLEGSR